MARVKFEDVANKEKSKSKWFSLKNDGDGAFVQFFYNTIEEFPTFTVHKAKVNPTDMFPKSIDCLRGTGDPIDVCPMCKAHEYVAAEVYAVMYNHSAKEVQIWKLSRQMQNTIKNTSLRCNGDFKNRVFEVVRNGRAGDKSTTYALYPADGKVPVDLSQYEEPDNFGIFEKTANEMKQYLETGSWNKNATPSNRREVEATTVANNEMPWTGDANTDFDNLGANTPQEDFRPRRRNNNVDAF